MKAKLKYSLIFALALMTIAIFTCGALMVNASTNLDTTTVVLSENSIKINKQEEVCVTIDVNGKEEKARYDIQDGASMRFSDPSGIRFTSYVSQQDYENLYWAYGTENVTLGTVLIKKVNYTDNSAFEIGDAGVVNVIANNISLWREESQTGTNDGILRFSAVITEIPADYYDVELYARSYISIVKDGETYVGYAPFDTVNNGRSILYIAGKVLGDGSEVLSNANRELLENMVAADLTSNVVTIDATKDLSEQIEKALNLGTIDRIYDASLAQTNPDENSVAINEADWINAVDGLGTSETARTKVLSVYVGEYVYRVKVLVVTKVITTANEFIAMRTYGGVELTATNFVYGGYYVLGNNIDLTGKEVGVPFVQSEDKAKHAVEGFTGIFDGRGFTVYGGTYYASIFGTLGKDAVIKNLAFINATAKVDHEKASGSVRIIADNTYGTVQDVLVDYTAVGNSGTNGVYWVSVFGMAYNPKFENVVVYGNTIDYTTGGGYALTFAEYIFGSGTTFGSYNYPEGSVRDEIEVSNIWSFGGSGNGITGNFSSGTNSFANGYLLSGIFVNHIDGHVFGADVSASEVMKGANFSDIWDLSGNKPSFASAKEFFATFELYSGLDANNGYSRIANENFELTCSGMDGDVSVIINNGSAISTTAVSGKISISANALALGDNAVIVRSSNDERNIKVNVYTAIIDTADELINMRRYDNVALDATNFAYGGYYVLGNNIDLTGKEIGVPFIQSTDISTKPIEGFTGIFDGCGYTVYGGTYFASMFGPLAKDAIVKNLAVLNATMQIDHEKALDDPSQVMGLVTYNTYGTIQNVLVDYTAVGNANTHGLYHVGSFGTIFNAKLENVVVYGNTTDALDGGCAAYTFGSYIFASGRTNGEQGYPQGSVRGELEVSNVWSFGGFLDGQAGVSGYSSYSNAYGCSTIFTGTVNLYSINTVASEVMSSTNFSSIWDLSGNKALFVSSAEFFNN